MGDKKNLKLIGSVIVGVVALGASIVAANVLKDVIEDKKIDNRK